MPQNALDKLVRDVGREEAEKAFYWNRAVIIMGISCFESSDWSIEKNFWHI